MPCAKIAVAPRRRPQARAHRRARRVARGDTVKSPFLGLDRSSRRPRAPGSPRSLVAPRPRPPRARAQARPRRLASRASAKGAARRKGQAPETAEDPVTGIGLTTRRSTAFGGGAPPQDGRPPAPRPGRRHSLERGAQSPPHEATPGRAAAGGAALRRPRGGRPGGRVPTVSPPDRRDTPPIPPRRPRPADHGLARPRRRRRRQSRHGLRAARAPARQRREGRRAARPRSTRRPEKRRPGPAGTPRRSRDGASAQAAADPAVPPKRARRVAMISSASAMIRSTSSFTVGTSWISAWMVPAVQMPASTSPVW